MVRRYEIVAIGLAVLTGVILATWSSRTIGGRAAAACDFLEGLEPGMSREEVSARILATFGPGAPVTNSDDGGVRVAWSFTHWRSDRFLLEFQEDRFVAARLVNDDLNLDASKAMAFCRHAAKGLRLYFALDTVAFSAFGLSICGLALGLVRWRDRKRRAIYFASALIAFLVSFAVSGTSTATLAIGSLFR